jgi:hypothetical protein
MRLLNTSSLRLESSFDSAIPGYAILSHTWAKEEVLFDDIRDLNKPLPAHKKGFAKVQGSCDQARRDGYGYILIDTCCIDKSSSAELSEAINSMFQWYHKSPRCYAYLADVNAPEGKGVAAFEQSRWFRRGWTLQELIAPRNVMFYDYNWCFIGMHQTSGDHPEGLEDLAEKICKASDIPVTLLRWYYYTRSRPLYGLPDALVTYPCPRPRRIDANIDRGRDLSGPRSVTYQPPTDGRAKSQLLHALRSLESRRKCPGRPGDGQHDSRMKPTRCWDSSR